MHIVHTPECKLRIKAYDAWILAYPNACTNCGATGVLYNPGVYRYPDGSGEPPSEDFCDKCVGNSIFQLVGNFQPVYSNIALGHCPRCAETLDVTDFIENLSAAVECPRCGWAGGAGADDFMPDVDCHCWEDED